MEIKRKIKNWMASSYGRFSGYGECGFCGDTWNWKKSKTIWCSDHNGLFALCEECFNKLSEEEVLYFYKNTLNGIIKDNPIEWTRTTINNALRKLKKEIKKEKEIPFYKTLTLEFLKKQKIKTVTDNQARKYLENASFTIINYYPKGINPLKTEIGYCAKTHKRICLK